jgi:hypothetical protein
VRLRVRLQGLLLLLLLLLLLVALVAVVAIVVHSRLSPGQAAVVVAAMLAPAAMVVAAAVTTAAPAVAAAAAAATATIRAKVTPRLLQAVMLAAVRMVAPRVLHVLQLRRLVQWLIAQRLLLLLLQVWVHLQVQVGGS